MDTSTIRFERASLVHKDCIDRWLGEPHVKEFWDTSQAHRDDILLFMKGRKKPSSYFGGIFTYWIGSIDNEPYCLGMTSEIKPDEPDLTDLDRQNLSKTKKTFSIDFMIGNRKYLGKGLASLSLEALTHFIHKMDQSVDTFFIDPEENNTRAKHVYEKAGFVCVGEFQRSFNERESVRHFLMVKKL